MTGSESWVDVPDFTRYQHTYNGHTKTIYTAGSGPLVFLLHEIPNPTPELFDLGRRLVSEGYTVHLPVFFGTPNRPFSTLTAVSALTLGCIRREFQVFASHQSSPVIDWIRDLCQRVLAESQQERVGMIGMCFTGNFALGLCAEPWMEAPVLSQPSLPYPISERHKRALHISNDVLQTAQNREALEILGLRFSADWMAPRERFDTLRTCFGDRFIGIEIDSSKNNPHQIRAVAHSVLTLDLRDEVGHPTQQALHAVLDFLERRLKIH